MTTPSTARKAGPLLGNGSTTSFPFAFKVFSANDIAVTIANSAGVETLLVLNTDYSVTVNANQETSPGGTVTYPISGSALPSGSVLVIVGDLDYDQPLDLPSGGNFSPLALENQLDRATMQMQQLKEQVDRSAKLPVTYTLEDLDEFTSNIVRLGDSAENIDTLADNISDINTVASDLNEPVSEIHTVAGAITNVNTVGNNINSVNTVAGSVANVNSVATNIANVNAVAGNAANINAVVGNSTNINAVAGNNANVTAVAGISNDVSTVAGIAADVVAVENIAAAVSAVAAIDDAVSIAANNVADINNFADVYQGGKATDPTLRNDGSALQNGDLYFNTTQGRMRVRVFGVWDDAITNVGAFDVETFSGTGAQTAFVLGTDPLDKANCQIYISGVYQQKTKYNVLGTTLTFTTAPPAGTDNIEVVISTPTAFGNLSTIQADVTTKAATATTQANIATTQAGIATTQAGIATTQQGLATAAKTAAEAARDAANVNARVYATTAAGIAATTNGQYFSVPSGASSEYLILYLNNAGTAVEQKRYPSAAAVEDLASQIFTAALEPTDQVAVAVTDPDCFSTLRISVRGNLITPTGIEDTTGTVLRRNNSDGTVDTLAVQEITTTSPAGTVAYTDIDGFGGLVIAADGKVTSYTPPAARPALTFDGKLQHVVSYGQSLSLGWVSSPVLTTAQRHSALKFSGGVRPFDSGTDPAVIYSSLVPLTETASGFSYESPMAGMFEMLYDSIEAENGFGHPDIDFRFLGSCAGKDGEPIANLAKGSSYYTRFIQQIQYGKIRANAAGWEYRVKAFCWTQGESDSANTQASYLSALRQLRTDLQTDIQAQTGFNDQLLCIHYQTYSNESNTAASPASLAQLQAHDEEPTKFALACPLYFMNTDGVHLTNITSAWMGAYYGLVYKRTVLEGGTWAPTKPIRVYSPAANTIDVNFNVPSGQLVWDFENVAPQPNKGFSVVNGSNVLQTISSVEIVGRRTVRITLSGAVPAGARVRYGVRARTNGITDTFPSARRVFGTACGNLRDNAGDTLKFRKLGLELPMHNWSVIFDKGVA